MTDYNDGKWHGWNGGECPVHPDSLVEISFYDRTSKEMRISGWSSGPERAGLNSLEPCWNHSDGYRQIIAFRVTKEHKETREFWLGYNWVTYREKADAEASYGTPSGRVIHVREVLE